MSNYWLQGAFQVMTQQPINYTIEEVEGLLDPANKVSSVSVLPGACFSISHARPPPQVVAPARGVAPLLGMLIC